MVKRTERPGARPAQARAQAQAEPESATKAPWPHEQHSGEGSASALDSLQKIEIRRVASQPAADPPPVPEEPARPGIAPD